MKKKKNVAKQIANLINDCDTDDRGTLLYDIGDELTKNAQGFTGNLFIRMAVQYGIKPNVEFKDD